MSARRGRPPHPDRLTPAEWQVLNLIRHGVGDAAIGRLRGTSKDAVRFHIANLRAKLAVPRRRDLVHWQGAPADSALAAGRADAGSPAPSESRPMDSEPTTLGPIGQVSRHVSDIGSAVAWYRDVLGLPHLYTYGTLAFFDCAGTRLFLSQPEGGGKVGTESVLYFRVGDIVAAHAALNARGVAFRGAPHMIHRHGDGTEEWMAFFADPDGNLLALMSQVRPLRE